MAALPGLIGMVLVAGGVTRRRSLLYVFAFACLLTMGMAMPGCGRGGRSGGTQTGTYTLTVTGKFNSDGGTLTHDTKFTLVVR